MFVILPEEDQSKYFMVSLLIQQLYREILSIADEKGGTLDKRVMFYCDELGTFPKIDGLEAMFSAGRSRKISIVAIIQSFAQLEQTYGKQGIRNLVNIFASKEDFLWDALQVSSARSGYCAKSDPRFVEELNRKKPKTIEKIKELWYRGNMSEQYRHYSNTRYHALNLHSYFQHGHYEIRCCNASLHAGEVRAQIVLALAISNAAMTKKYCSPSVSHSDNMRYSFRVWLLNLGLIGDEYKNCRTHLLKHLTGDIAWRHPEDGVAQRERLRQERIAARDQAQQNESPCDERVAAVCDDRQ